MKVVSLSPMWRDELAAKLKPGISLVTIDPSNAQSWTNELRDAQIVLTATFDAELASACGSLELLVCPAAGTDGIDRSSLPTGVELVNGVGHEIPMAEYVIGALIALRRRFAAADAALRQGVWRFGYFGSGEMVDESHGSTLGLVGFGRIGARVARAAAALGMACRAVTLHPGKPIEAGLLSARPGSIASSADVDDLIAGSDAIVVACELSPLTHGLLDARRFALMRSSAVLVNVARGPIVDEAALFHALEGKTIAAAAIDVWYHYPQAGSHERRPSAYAFDKLDNVLMTPHSSGWTASAKQRKLEFLARTINDWHEKRRSR